MNYLSYTYFGSNISVSGSATTLISLDELRAETTYNVSVYVQNDSDNFSDATNDTFTTSDIPEAATFTIMFSGDISTNAMNNLQIVTANALGLNYYRLQSGIRSTNTARRLETTVISTTFTWTIPALRNINEPTPA